MTVGIPHLIVGNTILATETFLDETFAAADETPAPGVAAVEETPVPEFTEPPEPTEPPPGVTPAPATPAPSPTPVIPPYPKDGGNGTLPAFGASVPWKRADPAQPWGNDGRFDLLLIGSDAGAGRWSRRNDVMLLVEVDVKTGQVAMIGLPRNLQNAPYPPGPARDASACGCQPGLINEMYVQATARTPGLWPGRGSVKGIGAVRSVVSTLTGRPIDAVLIVDLIGVIRVVDAMGGVDIDVPEAVVDDNYPDPGNHKIRLRIRAGKQHFDGREALAYARSRHMDSDYGRMDRQQTLLLAIREQLGPSLILEAPNLFAAAKGAAWTDLPREALPALLELFGRTADAKVKQLRIVPSRYPTWLTAAWVNQIRDDIADLLPGSENPRSIAVPRPVATPRPTPRPTAEADAQAHPEADPGTHAAPDRRADARPDRCTDRGADPGALTPGPHPPIGSRADTAAVGYRVRDSGPPPPSPGDLRGERALRDIRPNSARRRLAVAALAATLVLPAAMTPALAADPDDASTPAGPTDALPVGESVTLEGIVRVVIADDFRRGRSETSYALETEDGRVDLVVPDGELPDLGGRHAEVTGTVLPSGAVRVEDTVPVADAQADDAGGRGDIAGAPASAGEAGPSTDAVYGWPGPAVRKVAVVIASYTDHPAFKGTVEQMTEVMTGEAGTSVRQFFEIASRGRVSVDATVLGPWKLPVDSCDEASAFYPTVDAVVAEAWGRGIDLARFDHVIMWTPAPCASNWTALGEAPGQFIQMSAPYPDDGGRLDEFANVAAHEMGHNMGLLHANSLVCSDGEGDPAQLTDDCGATEYGDPFSTMGGNQGFFSGLPAVHWVSPLYDSSELAHLGWLDADEEQVVTAAGELRPRVDLRGR